MKVLAKRNGPEGITSTTMYKMHLQKVVLGILPLLSSLASVAQTPSPSPSPNIIYILADDLGYGDVSSYNEQGQLYTHHIDQLARSGVRFTDAHTSSAVCTPTRYGILTGRYNWRSTLKSSVLSGYSPALITPDRLTVGKLLQENGYHTAFVGKWHLGWDWSFIGDPGEVNRLSSNPAVDFRQPIKNGPTARGFTYSYGFSGSLDMPPYVYVQNGQPTSVPTDSTVNVDDKGFWRKGITAPDFVHADVLSHLTDQAVRYIERRAKGTSPFFLYFALPAPHTPILPTTEFLGKSNTNFYGDFVLQVDDVVGQVMDALEKRGLADNTLVIFTSDNGCSPKANFEELAEVGHDPSSGYRGHKADIYEGGHRVPFVVRWPARAKQGLVTDEVICTTDLMATVTEIIGTSLPPGAGEDSYSWLPILTETAYPKPLREATVHHSISGQFAIRQGDWKLILWPGSGGWSYPNMPEDLPGLPLVQLYNLANDPEEEENLAGAYPQRVNQLQALLARYVEEGRSTPGPKQQNDGPSHWPQLDWMKAEGK